MSGRPIAGEVAPPGRAPLLVIAVGNRSRGDDALGPMLLELLARAGVADDGQVELFEDFQLQVEHALDIEGRRAVLFVDAARPGLTASPTIITITADTHREANSHAMRPQAVLRVATDLGVKAPRAYLLAIPGWSFGLGEALSDAARTALGDALARSRDWLDQHLADAIAPR